MKQACDVGQEVLLGIKVTLSAIKGSVRRVNDENETRQNASVEVCRGRRGRKSGCEAGSRGRSQGRSIAQFLSNQLYHTVICDQRVKAGNLKDTLSLIVRIVHVVVQALQWASVGQCIRCVVVNRVVAHQESDELNVAGRIVDVHAMVQLSALNIVHGLQAFHSAHHQKDERFVARGGSRLNVGDGSVQNQRDVSGSGARRQIVGIEHNFEQLRLDFGVLEQNFLAVIVVKQVVAKVARTWILVGVQ